MNKSAFLNLIQHVSDISDQQTLELEKVAIAFPYCQTAHLLLAKSAFDKGSMLSAQRLRRASSYATDRQLLKKIIYNTFPAPEPVFEEADDTFAEAPYSEDFEFQVQEAVEQDEANTAIADGYEEDYEGDLADSGIEELPVATAEAPDSAPEINEAAIEETVSEVTETDAGVKAPDTDEMYSELAMLLTIDSLSPSSTDLLAGANPTTANEVTAPALAMFMNELQENLQSFNDAIAEERSAELFESKTPSGAAMPAAVHAPEEACDTEKSDDFDLIAGEAEPENKETAAAGEISYSFDEIDRLYAHDPLGYAMGTSRMGEVLQLKNEYTRARPQSFHPELILEYSKTHELEKAVQPNHHILSNQLDIIDQFLKLNPRLKTMSNLKLKPEPQEDLSLKSTKIKKGMASENLANIFLKQGKAKKAIKIYEQLMLKNPEKNLTLPNK